MKKILVAFDGLKYSESARDYAIQLAKQTGAQLVGAFLEDFTYTSYKIYDLVDAKGGVIGSAKRKFDKKDLKARAVSIKSFETSCQEAKVEYAIHRDRNVAIRELLHESIFADLLIIDASETLSHHAEKLPTSFIKDLLSHTQCPVLVVPRHFKPISKLVFLYDGEPSSVHAIKMFSYTLRDLKSLPVEVLSVNFPDSSHIPDNRLMKELLERHFPGAVYTVLTGFPEKEIEDHLKKQEEECMVVLGAYRRGIISRWFRSSMADMLMKDLRLPLFIAHNK